MFFYSQTWNKVKVNYKTCNDAYLFKKNKIYLFLKYYSDNFYYYLIQKREEEEEEEKKKEVVFEKCNILTNSLFSIFI